MFLLALVCALLAAGGQGYLSYADRTPAAALQARVGTELQLDGTRLTVRSFTVAPGLPAADPDRPDGPVVRGPAGSVLVLVVYEQQVDATVDVTGHFCDASLVADDGTTWGEDGDLGYALRRPEALTCADSDDQPLRAGALREIGASYLIPARYADQVRWRLEVQPGARAVEFRR